MTTAFTAENFQREVLEAEVPVLVDFWAEWCGPCRMIAPVVDELASLANGEFQVGKVEADSQRDLVVKYNISALPTLLIFKDGEVARSLVGVHPKSALLSALKALQLTAGPAA